MSSGKIRSCRRWRSSSRARGKLWVWTSAHAHGTLWVSTVVERQSSHASQRLRTVVVTCRRVFERGRDAGFHRGSSLVNNCRAFGWCQHAICSRVDEVTAAEDALVRASISNAHAVRPAIVEVTARRIANGSHTVGCWRIERDARRQLPQVILLTPGPRARAVSQGVPWRKQRQAERGEARDSIDLGCQTMVSSLVGLCGM